MKQFGKPFDLNRMPQARALARKRIRQSVAVGQGGQARVGLVKPGAVLARGSNATTIPWDSIADSSNRRASASLLSRTQADDSHNARPAAVTATWLKVLLPRSSLVPGSGVNQRQFSSSAKNASVLCILSRYPDARRSTISKPYARCAYFSAISGQCSLPK